MGVDRKRRLLVDRIELSLVGYHIRGEESERMSAKRRNKLFKISWHIVRDLHEPGAVCYPRAILGLCLGKFSKDHGMIECRVRMARAKPHLRPTTSVHPSMVHSSEIGQANGQFVLGVPFRLDSRR